MSIIPNLNQFNWDASYGQTKRELLVRFEYQYVKQLLERHSGNLSADAREARMDRKHLSDLAIKHGLR